MASIGDRLQSARTRLFVGRHQERRQFRDALTTSPPPFNVLHVFGPGGVGKTELLQAFARCCDEIDVPYVQLDTRDVDPTPDAFRTALRDAVGLAPDRTVLPALGAEDDRAVLLLDTVETIEALDDWLRTHFLPDLPEHIIIVMAGRHEPAAAWRTDPGWRALVHTMPLRNLDAEAGARLLLRRNVPPDQHDAILRFTHGHPLATALVADLMDQRGTDTFEPTDAPDVLNTLLERFVQKVPSPAHRAALETAALVRHTTEAVLRATLDRDDAHDLFEWLRTLSFMRPGERGLVPHALVRNALAADLRWRHPERHDTLHERARQFYTDRLKDAPARTVPNLLSDLTVLLRDHPFIRPFFDRLRSQWDEAEGLIEDELRDDDRPVLREMVATQEGPAAADLARHWMDRQPEGIHVYRDGTGTPVGFLLTIALDAAAPEARTADVPERIEALCTLLDDTAERLAVDPRDEKYYRAVHRTYLKPAPTQEQAAEQLGVPFSTFRRHLNQGLDRVSDILWDRGGGLTSNCR